MRKDENWKKVVLYLVCTKGTSRRLKMALNKGMLEIETNILLCLLEPEIKSLVYQEKYGSQKGATICVAYAHLESNDHVELKG